ncbi:antitoxin HigA-1 [Azospirillaceae bacterium]
MTFPAIDNLPPVHPGEILRDELEALGLSARRFASHVGVPPNAVSEILNGERRITATMALRLAKAFGTTPQYWTGLQSYYETKLARSELGEKLESIRQLPQIGHAA